MDTVPVEKKLLDGWVRTCNRVQHLNTLVRREIEAGHQERALHLANRARKACWAMFQEMVASGGSKPDGYLEPGTPGESSLKRGDESN